MTTQLSTPLAGLRDAHEAAARVFAILDGVGPLLDEPERGAALELKAQAGDLVRRLGSLIVFAGVGR